jgi:uncharacterized protein YndB with AHSA1/START domain
VKDKRLKIVIDRPIGEVFNFTLDPSNTPKWIGGIVKELTSEWPPKEGTIYKNQSTDGVWHEYKLVEIEKEKTFVLSEMKGDYHVRYTFKPSPDDSTEFEYYEWVEKGELDDTVSQDTLVKLKEVIESEKKKP